MNESVQRLESKYAEARSEESMDIDLNDSVQRLEAKCAGVREELGRMALSEQYMRTKQAQLRARKKELEAKEATIKAELREKEAAAQELKREANAKAQLEAENISRVSNIESDNSQNVGLEDYNNISDRIFPHFTTPSIKICLG